MNKPLGTVCMICLIVGSVCLGAADSTGEAGRPNPFAGILKKNRLATEALMASVEGASTESPRSAWTADRGLSSEPGMELSVASVELRYLQAKTVVEAFRALLSPVGKMAAQDNSNLLLVADTNEVLPRIVAEIRKADRAMAGVVMETVTLRFLTAANMVTVVEKVLSPYGKVAANIENNSLIICDTPDNLARILQEIRKADRTPVHILVEVVLLDVRLSDDTEIGVNWDLLSTDQPNTTYRQQMFKNRLSAVAPDEVSLADATAYNTVGQALGGNFSVVSGSVRAVVNAIQAKRDTRIIACPKAMMYSGKTAKIEAVQDIPYRETTQTSGGGALASTQFRPAGVTLEVTATVTDHNEICLKVDTQQSVEVDRFVAEIPVLDKRTESTSLLLKDGQIVIMGGLRRQEKTQQVSQVPLMGDLPVVGALFRTKRDVISTAELVVLLSPHLYQGEAVPSEVMRQMDEMRNASGVIGVLPKENTRKSP